MDFRNASVPWYKILNFETTLIIFVYDSSL